MGLFRVSGCLAELERLQAQVGELKGELRSTQAEADLAQAQNQAAGQLLSKTKVQPCHYRYAPKGLLPILVPGKLPEAEAPREGVIPPAGLTPKLMAIASRSTWEIQLWGADTAGSCVLQAERNVARKEAMTLGQRLLEQARALDQLRQEHRGCDGKAQQLQERLHQVIPVAPEVFSVPDRVAPDSSLGPAGCYD